MSPNALARWEVRVPGEIDATGRERVFLTYSRDAVDAELLVRSSQSVDPEKTVTVVPAEPLDVYGGLDDRQESGRPVMK